MSALFESHLDGLPLINRGKVRDIYAVDDAHMLIVTTDRLSAFDVVLPQPIPGKGEVLTRVSIFGLAAPPSWCRTISPASTSPRSSPTPTQRACSAIAPSSCVASNRCRWRRSCAAT